MKMIWGAIGFCLVIGVVQTQTVTVNKQNEKVKNETIEVFATTLEGRKEDIQQALNRFVKETGKVKLLSTPTTITEPIIGGTPFSKGVLYAGTQA